MNRIVLLEKGVVDLHCHILSGVDDGAQTDDEMYAMLCAAYTAGIRHMFATPHYNPALFLHNPEREHRSYERLCAYAHERFPDMRIERGNELFCRGYHADLIKCGECLTLGGSAFVLTEFDPGESYSNIKNSLSHLIDAGYVPLLAHVERYACLYHDYERAISLKALGTRLLANVASFTNLIFVKERVFLYKLIRSGALYAVTTDAHDPSSVYPHVSACRLKLKRKFGDAADKLFYPALIHSRTEKVLSYGKQGNRI